MPPENTVLLPAAATPSRLVAPLPQGVSRHGLARHALVLGMMTALGAFGIDAYLPAFPAIARSLGVDEGRVQLSLVSYFVALALGQLVYGPVSDRVGRRTPLLFGFALFVASSVAATFAHSVGVLVAARFVQGIGVCAGMSIARAVIRDLRTGEEAARLYALMILVLGVSPVLAPLCGSLLLRTYAWPSVFWLLATLGTLSFLTVLLFLEETHPPDRRAGHLGEAFATYGRLACDRQFLAIVMVGGLSQAALFAYLAGSPFVYITLHGVAPSLYSALFALNAVALIGSAQWNVRLIRALGIDGVLRLGAVIQTSAALLLIGAAWLRLDSVAVLASLLFLTVGCQGLLGPTSGVLALEPHAAAAGAASALMGAIQFGCGAASSALVSAFFNGTSVPMAATIAGCAIGAFALVFSRPAARAANQPATDRRTPTGKDPTPALAEACP